MSREMEGGGVKKLALAERENIWQITTFCQG